MAVDKIIKISDDNGKREIEKILTNEISYKQSHINMLIAELKDEEEMLKKVSQKIFDLKCKIEIYEKSIKCIESFLKNTKKRNK